MQNEIRYFSMFTGVGGFEVGLERANNNGRKTDDTRENSENIQQRKSNNECDNAQKPIFSCVGMSEIDKYSSQVLKRRFPTTKNWEDCTKIDPSELPDFDMLCGGFPCQAFSIAGKRRGFEDARGTMFFEVTRILKVKRPKIVLLENVKGLLNHAKGETFRVILQALDELGYEVQWMVLNSKFHGVPQNRERVFIIGNLRETGRSEILPFGEICSEIDKHGPCQPFGTLCSQYAKNPTDGSYIKHFQQAKAQHSRIYDTEGISPTLAGASKLSGDCTPKIRAVLTPDRPEKRQNGRRFKEDGEPSFTLTGQGIHGVAIDRMYAMGGTKSGRSCIGAGRVPECGNAEMSIRRLTPIECERLQGFPDNWTEYGIDENENKVKMSDTQRYKQMGNAVTTKVIVAVGSKILLCKMKIKNGKGKIDGHSNSNKRSVD